MGAFSLIVVINLLNRYNMDPRRKKSLTAARYDLSKNLMSTQSVCDFLISRGELTDSLAEEIMAQATRDKQNSKLCQIIGARGNSAYDNFRLALVETEAPSFLLEKLPDYSIGTAATSPAQLAPDSGCSLTDDLLKRYEKIEINDHVDSRLPGSSSSASTQSNSGQQLARSDIDVKRSTGLALVINNVDFSHMMKRKGSDVDHHNIKLLLSAFGFQLFEENRTRNLREKDMKDVLERFAGLQDHQKYSCSVVVVMTHGKDGWLYATDSSRDNLVSVDWMLKLFHGDNCPNLNGKPKLFFLQACRGERMDKGADLYGYDNTDSAGAGDSNGTGSGNSSAPIDLDSLSPSQEETLYRKMLEQDYDETDAIRRGDILASQSDMFVAYATVPGYVSWRNSPMAHGSYRLLCMCSRSGLPR